MKFTRGTSHLEKRFWEELSQPKAQALLVGTHLPCNILAGASGETQLLCAELF